VDFTLENSGGKADLRLLESTNLTLTTINDIDNIRVSKTYDDVKFTQEGLYELEFQVPKNMTRVEFKLNSEVQVSSRVTVVEGKRWGKAEVRMVRQQTGLPSPERLRIH